MWHVLNCVRINVHVDRNALREFLHLDSVVNCLDVGGQM